MSIGLVFCNEGDAMETIRDADTGIQFSKDLLSDGEISVETHTRNELKANYEKAVARAYLDYVDGIESLNYAYGEPQD